jgi:RimJ/RimL family protein N-acetyltransferase
MAGLQRVPELRTERLVLRAWRADDLEPFARINADVEVMRHFPATLDRTASDEMVERIERTWETSGIGLWAVEVIGGAAFIGFVGLLPVPFEAAFTPAVEVGWRLDRDHWGRGYAPEAAAEAVHHGFEDLDLAEIVSFTTPANMASRRVMEKLGMSHDPADDFDHPRLTPGHPMRRHVLHRLTAEQWRRRGPFDGAAAGR